MWRQPILTIIYTLVFCAKVAFFKPTGDQRSVDNQDGLVVKHKFQRAIQSRFLRPNLLPLFRNKRFPLFNTPYESHLNFMKNASATFDCSEDIQVTIPSPLESCTRPCGINRIKPTETCVPCLSPTGPIAKTFYLGACNHRGECAAYTDSSNRALEILVQKLSIDTTLTTIPMYVIHYNETTLYQDTKWCSLQRLKDFITITPSAYKTI